MSVKPLDRRHGTWTSITVHELELDVFDDHLNRRVRSTFYAHGPERAYVIPDGNYDAFEECVGFASEVWNGAGAIILVASETAPCCPAASLT